MNYTTPIQPSRHKESQGQRTSLTLLAAPSLQDGVHELSVPYTKRTEQVDECPRQGCERGVLWRGDLNYGIKLLEHGTRPTSRAENNSKRATAVPHPLSPVDNEFRRARLLFILSPCVNRLVGMLFWVSRHVMQREQLPTIQVEKVMSRAHRGQRTAKSAHQEPRRRQSPAAMPAMPYACAFSTLPGLALADAGVGVYSPCLVGTVEGSILIDLFILKVGVLRTGPIIAVSRFVIVLVPVAYSFPVLQSLIFIPANALPRHRHLHRFTAEVVCASRAEALASSLCDCILH